MLDMPALEAALSGHEGVSFIVLPWANVPSGQQQTSFDQVLTLRHVSTRLVVLL